MAEEALEEKYGEEFIVHDVWSKSPHDFYATCSPKANEEVVFKAVLWKDDGEIEYDEYVQGIVARQISDKLESELQEYFGGCVVRTHVFYEPDLLFDNVLNVSLKDYANETEECCLVEIYFEEDYGFIDKEYEYFSVFLQNQIINKEIPEIAVGVYKTDKDSVDWCREYFKTHSEGYSEYTDKRSGWKKMSFGYLENHINETYEEYKKQREEMMSNE